MNVQATIYKNELIKNLVILFAFFCAFEPLEYFFWIESFLFLICMFFEWISI